MSSEDLSGSVVIDAHCHTFNARDLPIYGFLKHVALNADEEVLPNLVLPLARMLSGLTYTTPGANQELTKIRQLMGGGLDILEAINGVDSELSEEEFIASLNSAIQTLQESEDAENTELLEHIQNEAGMAHADHHLEGFVTDLARGLWTGGGVVARYTKWMRLLSRYRFKITNELISTYSSDDTHVDLFTPALIDYDHWVDDSVKDSLADQMKLMKANIKLQEGRIHPFFPFDPWRHAYEPEPQDRPLNVLNEALSSYGFIGAKLYPPLGYSATDNSSHTEFPEHIPESGAAFGAKIDRALDELYDFCMAEDVPILTHCADSNEVRKHFGKRADPSYWAQVIQNYPTLRVNLGHFGDLDSLNTEEGWAWRVGELLDNPDLNVYGDISHHNSMLTNRGRLETIQNLKALFKKYPGAKDKIMFGTDWMMLARIKDYDKFLRYFKQDYLAEFGKKATARFMGENAATFLGLRQGEKNRKRLDGFYRNNAIPTPPWMNAIDSAGG